MAGHNADIGVIRAEDLGLVESPLGELLQSEPLSTTLASYPFIIAFCPAFRAPQQRFTPT
jgi:hypothetical protein